jgi:hypothetical protein
MEITPRPYKTSHLLFTYMSRLQGRIVWYRFANTSTQINSFTLYVEMLEGLTTWHSSPINKSIQEQVSTMNTLHYEARALAIAASR